MCSSAPVTTTATVSADPSPSIMTRRLSLIAP
jgi:hypothetical protein